MDRELEKRWIKLPEIGIDYVDNVMTINGRILSIPDTSPETLSDYLDIGHETINEYLREIKQGYRFWRHPTNRRSILIGRLALTGREDEVFTEEGLHVRYDSDLDVIHLDTSLRTYWMAVDTSLSTPEVHRNLTFKDSERNGTWLGLRRP